MSKIVCPHCSCNVNEGNFCSNCGKKLVETCNCGFLNKPFNCGYEKCPALKIFTDPKLKSSHLQLQVDKKSV